MSDISTKPYLLRALYEWCTDNGFTPYIVVSVDAGTRVPMEFVKDGEIVLNISFEATGNLKMDNEFITFKARFGGVARELEIPVDNVSAIYARENGQGMAFEVVRHDADIQGAESDEAARETDKGPFLAPVPSGVDAHVGEGQRPDQGDDPDRPKPGGRPRLTRIK
jgi:stringent starvation protein B